MRKAVLMLLLLLLALPLARSAEMTAVADHESDTVGELPDAAASADIVEMLGDAAGSQLSVALIFSRDPQVYLRGFPSAVHLLTWQLKVTDGKDAVREVTVSVGMQAGSVPDTRVVPDAGCVVYNFYSIRNGYQICIDLIEDPKSISVSATAEIQTREASVSDSVTGLALVPHKGDLETIPETVVPRPQERDTNRPLNRDKYVPPKGEYGWVDDPEAALQYLADARKALEDGRREHVWELAEDAILNAPDYPTKLAARDLIFKAGSIEPAEIGDEEEMRVNGRIGQERIRYYRELEPATKLGRIELEKLCIKTAKDFAITSAVWLDDADKMGRDYLNEIANEPDTALDDLVKSGGHRAVKKAADKAEAGGDLNTAFRCYHRYRALLMGSVDKFDDMTLVDGTIERLGKAILASCPKEDLKLLSDAVNHPAWGRLRVFPTRHFIFIVPEQVQSRVKADSIMRLDVAFTFEADLYKVSAAKYSERVTVFLKELWGFRGGTGGGSQINIGYKWAVDNSNPAIVDSSLYTHELAHCMTGGHFSFLFPGFSEGIANMGAAFCEDILGRHANAVAAFDRQRKEFETYYLDLNVPYWRVQNYAPAFTMMTWLVRDEPLVAGIYDWRRMRNSLRDFLNYPIRTRSLFQYGWAWMKCLEAWFGERVWKHYGECRFPIGPGEPALLQDDLDFYHYDLAAAKLDGLAAMLGLIERIEKENPRSYMRQLAMYAALGRAISDGKSDTADDLVRKLGIVTEANVVGPLGENNGFASPVSPEWHTDLSEEFRFSGTVSRWKAQECDLAGFFLRRSDYRGDWSGYALSYIYCPQETQAVLWVRAKNQYGAWLNNAMVEKEPIYNQFVWDIYSDFAFHHITFKKGWNKLLGRFHFNQGDGMIRMRITDRSGNAIEGLQITADDHEKEIPPIPQAVKGSAIFTDTFDNSLSTKNWGTPAGSFKVKSGMLYSQNGGATKFRFVAVPDEKKDPDPAIMWLKNQTVTRLESYAIEFEVKALDPRIPVMYITLEGSGKEIITSGISIHLSEKWGTLNWQLAHYDTIYCTGSVKKFPHAQSYIFKIEKARDFYSLAINDTVLFQSVSLPPVKRGMIGLAFTEKALALDALSVFQVRLKE